MNAPRQDRRGHERVPAGLAMNLGTASAIARNVSASGMYFEADTPYAIGTEIRFSVDLETPGGKRVLKCRGEIVWLKPQGGKIGIEMKILESSVEAD